MIQEILFSTSSGLSAVTHLLIFFQTSTKLVYFQVYLMSPGVLATFSNFLAISLAHFQF